VIQSTPTSIVICTSRLRVWLYKAKVILHYFGLVDYWSESPSGRQSCGDDHCRLGELRISQLGNNEVTTNMPSMAAYQAATLLPQVHVLNTITSCTLQKYAGTTKEYNENLQKNK
jgi:hypothetical protein